MPASMLYYFLLLASLSCWSFPQRLEPSVELNALTRLLFVQFSNAPLSTNSRGRIQRRRGEVVAKMFETNRRAFGAILAGALAQPALGTMGENASTESLANESLANESLVTPLQILLNTTCTTDPLFQRLRNKYLLMRPGETLFEAADIVDSNPINKQATERGLTAKGREQVMRSARLLRDSDWKGVVFYDNGARASQTAEIIAQELSIPRASMEPEYRWLEARGLGSLEGTSLSDARKSLRELDMSDSENKPDETEDGTPNDSVLDVFSRMRNTISKCESVTSGASFMIIGGDATVLSVFAAAACQVDLSEHGLFELPPGTFYDLRELVRECRSGLFVPKLIEEPTKNEIKAARAVLRDLGSRMFTESSAGSMLVDGSG